MALRIVARSMRGLAGGLIDFEAQQTAPPPDMLGHVVVDEPLDGEDNAGCVAAEGRDL